MKTLKIILITLLIIQILALGAYFAYDYNRAVKLNTDIKTALKEYHDNPDYLFHGYPILGTIRIPKIDLYYPIIQYKNNYTLSLTVNHFAGSAINQDGNDILAAHNARNLTMFGRLKELKIGDEVILTDNKGNSLTYVVNDIYVTTNDDPKIFKQDDTKKTLTLSTCLSNQVNNQRRILTLNVKS